MWACESSTASIDEASPDILRFISSAHRRRP